MFNRSRLPLCLGFLLALLYTSRGPAADDPPRPKPGAGQPGGTRAAVNPPKPLDPRGRMEDHPTDKPARYYLWHDRDGWHLRSCSRLVNKFEGTVRVEGGAIRKFRPIGIDPKGRGADQFGLNKDRTELKFALHTGQSFDGFDFTADETKATLEFELLINGKPMPARVFIGRDGEHPRGAKFTFPAEPERPDGEEPEAGTEGSSGAAQVDAKPAAGLRRNDQ